jgi:hypothetical protein
MRLRSVQSVFAAWAISWIVVGLLVGTVMGLGDTGHVGLLGTLVILGSAGAIFGTLGGVAFAGLFISLLPLLRLRLVRVGVAGVLGAVSGVLGIYVVDRIVGISGAIQIGTSAGSLTGIVCGALFDSADDRHQWPPRTPLQPSNEKRGGLIQATSSEDGDAK